MQFFLDMRDNPFLLNGLLAGLLASVSCGIIGPYVITKRIVFLSGAIAHIAVGGIGASIFLSTLYPDTFGWLQPLHGAVVVSLLSAVLLAVVHERVSERMDTLIGALWSVGMAVGIMLIKFTPGYNTELMAYLFGSIVFVETGDLTLMIGLNVVIVATVLLFHKRLLAVCLDPQHADLQGVNVLRVNIVLLCLVALTVICLIKVVGLILVLALLTLPAATVAHHARRMASVIFVSILLAMVVTTAPRLVVYEHNISPEPAVVLAAAGLYLLSVVMTRVLHRVRRHP